MSRNDREEDNELSGVAKAIGAVAGIAFAAWGISSLVSGSGTKTEEKSLGIGTAQSGNYKPTTSKYQSTTYKPATTPKYSVSYAGKSIETTVTNKGAVADEWVDKIISIYGNKLMVVGLDIEWRPNNKLMRNNPPATLQLCIDDKCLILQLLYMDFIPQSLQNFLTRSNFTFVGVKVGEDIAKLIDEYGLECTCSADLREVAMHRWPGRFQQPAGPGLSTLARELLGLEMEKPEDVRRGEWDAPKLLDGQIKYACIDAYVSYMIGHKLLIEKYAVW